MAFCEVTASLLLSLLVTTFHFCVLFWEVVSLLMSVKLLCDLLLSIQHLGSQLRLSLKSPKSLTQGFEHSGHLINPWWWCLSSHVGFHLPDEVREPSVLAQTGPMQTQKTALSGQSLPAPGPCDFRHEIITLSCQRAAFGFQIPSLKQVELGRRIFSQELGS